MLLRATGACPDREDGGAATTEPAPSVSACAPSAATAEEPKGLGRLAETNEATGRPEGPNHANTEASRDAEKSGDIRQIAAQLGVDLHAFSGGVLHVLDRDSLSRMTDEAIVQRVLDLQTLLTDLTYQVEAARVSNLALQRENDTLRASLASLQSQAEEARLSRPYAQEKASAAAAVSAACQAQFRVAELRAAAATSDAPRPGALVAAKALAAAESDNEAL
ncbi:hypothetical protein BESB_040930 [Besnoitia besnoiti]|uniref:Uncharacterized protein n=1 Tax=Besnoitia besnoiti TaxID=94643 RepID=A0A2A9MI28_BESBE|nr:hypothetical protein BESB_040930 [Besnoitia besnoiti]PFH37635.1 hypothetical protein BESB_040930 [Besnoitia besnoiti]